MKLNEKYKIEAEELNVIIYELRTPKAKEDEDPKEPKWVPISYHATVEQAYNSIVNKEINRTGLNDLEVVVNKIKDLKKFVREVVNK